MHDMNNDIAKVLISEEQLQAKVAELGAQISRDYDTLHHTPDVRSVRNGWSRAKMF